MEKSFLEDCLAKELSLDAIGELIGRHPSTVSYWLKKHGLEAGGAARHAPKGEVDPELLRQRVAEGKSIREIADELGAGYSTIRYWIRREGLETERSARRKEGKAAAEAGLLKAYMRCATHGHTAFFLRPDGGFRCAKCGIAAVSKRRRQVKRTLVDEAGGCCQLCGFEEHQAALQFHHLDPSGKSFHLSHQGMTRGIGKMRAEARKCVLLCANCHALVEAGVKEVPVTDR
ncbi:MAG TPA: helix-turn-helix domain-containing protein [Solirubrobacterales bacterium]|nr:helix-turn-helix domain-containing protein [Solirubrobacterales bacterium]